MKLYLAEYALISFNSPPEEFCATLHADSLEDAYAQAIARVTTRFSVNHNQSPPFEIVNGRLVLGGELIFDLEVSEITPEDFAKFFLFGGLVPDQCRAASHQLLQQKQEEPALREVS